MTRIVVLLMSLLAGTNAGAYDVPTGRFDNHAQAGDVPRVTLAIDTTPQPGWTLWRVHLELDGAAFDQTWAMHTETHADGSGALVPSYQLNQTEPPAASAFDPAQWLALEACALRGRFGAAHAEGFAEGEPCVAVSMNVGARRALLPVAFSADRDAVRIDLNLRGARTSLALARVP